MGNFKKMIVGLLLLKILGRRIDYELIPQKVVSINPKREKQEEVGIKHYCVKLYRNGTYIGKIFVVKEAKNKFAGNYLNW